jgi:hypothetical protein
MPTARSERCRRDHGSTLVKIENGMVPLPDHMPKEFADVIQHRLGRLNETLALSRGRIAGSSARYLDTSEAQIACPNLIGLNEFSCRAF